MSITVIITRDDNGAPLTREVYEQGARFTVENGELNIISGGPELVALYGSGNWLSVHVDDHVAVVTTKPAEDESSDDSDSDSFDFGLGDSDSADIGSDSDTAPEDSDTASDDSETATEDSETASDDSETATDDSATESPESPT